MIPAIEALVRLFYPAHCGICKDLLKIEASTLCLDCAVRLEEMRFDMLEAINSPEKSASWEEAWSLFPYESLVRDLLKDSKFKSKPWLLKAFRPALRDFFKAITSESPYDLLIPVPQGKSAWLERQFNPAETLAVLFSDGRMPIAADVLVKKSRVPPQSTLGREERLANPWGAFKMLRPGKVLKRRVLVIDDILTTGATADEVCRLIVEAGASKVGLLTLARTPANVSRSLK